MTVVNNEKMLENPPKPFAHLKQDEALYENQDSNLPQLIALQRKLFNWQWWVKTGLVVLFLALLGWQIISLHCLIVQVLTPGFVTVLNVSLLKIILAYYTLSIIGLISGLVALAGRWFVKSFVAQEENHE